MRKITRDACAAFQQAITFDSANTRVSVCPMFYASSVTLYLQSHAIARRRTNIPGFEITTAGWQTATTKERLNGLPGVQVYHKNFQLFLNGKLWDGNWIKIQ